MLPRSSTVVQKSPKKVFKMTKSRKNLLGRSAVATTAMCAVFVNLALCCIVTAMHADDEPKANMPSDSFCEDNLVVDVIEKQQHDGKEEKDYVYDINAFSFDHIQKVPWSDKEVDWDDYFTEIYLADTYDLFGCDEYIHNGSENNKFATDHDAWMILRNTYNAVVWSKYDSSIPFPASDENGFFVPIQVKEVNKRHEGGGEVVKQMEVYVTQSVKAGDLVWVPRQQAKFDKLAFQRFLVAIPPEIACVVVDWVYAPHDDLICLDIDESSIISSSFSSEDMDEDDMDDHFNAGCLPNSEWVPGGCDLNMFALRDIDAGERLLINFEDYSIPVSWEWHDDFYNVAKRSIKYEHKSLISSFIETGEEPWDDEDVDWEDFFEMRLFELEHLLNCWNQYGTEQRIPNESSWRGLQEAYRSIDGYEDEFLFPPSANGFQVPIEIKQTKGKGRGVFVTEQVKRGELVVLPHNTAKFRKGYDFRRFVASVPLELVCDVLQWSYVAFFDDHGAIINPCIAMDLDEASIMNEGTRDDKKDTNLGCILEAEWVPGGCDNLFALRDIEAGEELLCDYSDFALTHGWAWLNL